MKNHVDSRITIFAGHYGSGKTNLAVNYALDLRTRHDQVVVCDVDTVNPYFRTKDSEYELTQQGIRLIAPQFANTNLDIPSLPPETSVAFSNREVYSVFDVGGDDAGAIALGQFADKINAIDHEMLLVVNRHRPLTSKPEQLLLYLRDIEAAAQVRFTGLVNNPNLGEQTTADTLLDSLAYIHAFSEMSGLPIRMHCIREDLAQGDVLALEPLVKIKIFKKKIWKI